MTLSIPDGLFEGYRTFREKRYTIEVDRYHALADGQSPSVMIISCADSRVDPATIFSAAPGELYVVRNVAALVPPYEPDDAFHGTSSAIEYGILHLNVEHVVVMGHGMCGGIAAALASADKPPHGQFIGPWVSQLDDVRDIVLDDMLDIKPKQRQQSLEHLSIKYSLDNLLGFPFVRDAMRNGDLALHGAWFSIYEGELYWLDDDSGEFDLVRFETH